MGSEDMPEDLGPGEVQLHSFVSSGLLPGDYEIDITQEVAAPPSSDSTRVDLSTGKSFTVEGQSPFRLPPDSIQSFYPAEGGAVESRILPHVVLSDPHIPWALDPDASGTLRGQLGGRARIPWLALLVFTRHELQALPAALGDAAPARSPTMAVSMSVSELCALKDSEQLQIPFAKNDPGTSERVDVIFVSKPAYAAYFDAQPIKGTVWEPLENPDDARIARYAYLSHVRRARSTQAQSLETDAVGVVLGHRTGPVHLSSPAPAYAHLVSLIGVQAHLGPVERGTLTALVSLHSWTFNWTPRYATELPRILRTLEDNVRGLARDVRSLTADPPSTDTQWLKDRMADGYTFVNHRLESGESTTALYRGPLMPKPSAGGDEDELLGRESTLHGTGLQKIDASTGFLDISYHVAWELGRSLAIETTAFTEALLRLRAQVLSACTRRSGAGRPDSSVGPRDATTNVPAWLACLEQEKKGFDELPENGRVSVGNVADQRWVGGIINRTPSHHLDDAPRFNPKFDLHAARNFLHELVTESITVTGKGSRDSQHLITVAKFVHEEVLSLKTIPHNYLFPEPDILDGNAILTFHLDSVWLNALVDGCLSVGNQSAADDRVKSEIKVALNSYIKAEYQSRTSPPGFPRWGFVLCGRLLQVVPDPRIRTTKDASSPLAAAGLLQTARLRNDALLVLFDRSPEWFTDGVIISRPAQQQCFAAASHLSNVGIRFDFRAAAVPAPGSHFAADSLKPKVLESLPWPRRRSVAFQFSTRCLNVFSLLEQYTSSALSAFGEDRFASEGSAADVAVALSEKLVELQVVCDPEQLKGARRQGPPPGPFILAVEREAGAERKDGVRAGEHSNYMYSISAYAAQAESLGRAPALATASLQPSSGAVALASDAGPRAPTEEAFTVSSMWAQKRVIPSAAKAAQAMKAAQAVAGAKRAGSTGGGASPELPSPLLKTCRVRAGPAGADVLLHVTAGPSAPQGPFFLQRLRIIIPHRTGGLRAADNAPRAPPVVRVVGVSAGAWAVGAAFVSSWPPRGLVGISDPIAGPAFLAEVTAAVAVRVVGIDLTIMLTGVQTDADAAGRLRAIEVVEDYWRGGGKTVDKRTVASRCTAERF